MMLLPKSVCLQFHDWSKIIASVRQCQEL